jgi:hypothetical protein
MAHKMHLSISEMYYVLFNAIPERLNADCLPPSIKLDQGKGQFHLEPLLFIGGDTIKFSLPLDCDALHLSEAPGFGFCLSIG